MTSRALSGLTNGAAVIASIAIAVLAVQTVANAVMRTTMNAPLQGTNEISQYWLMPLIAYFGLGLANARGEDIDARIGFDRFPRRVQEQFIRFGDLVFGITMAAFAVFGFIEALRTASIGLTSGLSGTPIGYAYLAVPIGSALMAGVLLRKAALGSRLESPEAEGELEADPDSGVTR